MALQLIFNPISGQFDYIDVSTSASSYWLEPVASFVNLPGGDPDGASRVVLDEDAVYSYNQGTLTWIFAGKIKTTAVGSSPNSNGYSVSDNNTLTLQPADGTNPGVITAGTQTIGGAKTFSSQLTSTVSTGTAPFVISSTTKVSNLYVDRAALADTVTTNANLTGPITSVGNATSVASQTGTGSTFVMDTSPTLVTPNIGAATGTSLSVSGQLTSTITTGTAPLVVSSTTQVANLNAATAGTATNANNVATTQVSTNASFFPLFVASSVNGNQAVDLGTGLTFNPSSNTLTTTTFVGSLTGSSSGNLLKAPGDINETSFSAANNQAVAADVTGLAFANATVRSFEAIVSIHIDATTSLFEQFKLYGIQRGSDWQMSQTSVGDSSGIVFSITTAGQVQYTSTNSSGWVASTLKFRALTTSV